MKKENLIKVVVLILVVSIVIGIFIYKNSKKPKIENTQNNSENNVSIYSNEEKLPTLLDFGSTTCEPCKEMMPILDSIEKQYEGKVNVKFVNVYTDSKNTQKYNIRTIPTQIFLDVDGKTIYRHEGVLYENEIIEKLTEMGVK